MFTHDKAAYKINEFVARYNVSRRTVYREIADGRLSAKKCGARTLIPAEAADHWLRQLPEADVQAGEEGEQRPE